MTDTMQEENLTANAEQSPEENNASPGPADFREASYVVLFIAAIFIINALETGSYRTPWPVAIITALAGIGLFAYSIMSGARQQ